jgi:SAM-dependent methyltransferase
LTDGPQIFVFDGEGEARRTAPATQRNRDAIAGVLNETLPDTGNILEIASGTGEHIAYFAQLFPTLNWQPSDPDPAALASILAWSAETDCTNLRTPLEIDAAADWDIHYADAVICINMVHISPWSATLGLLRNAARILPAGAPLFLYGPYRQHGRPTAPSNEDFDESLKSKDPKWGLRYVEDVAHEASDVGLVFDRLIEMPANNLSLIFRRADPQI